MAISATDVAKNNAPLITFTTEALASGAKAEVTATVAAGITFFVLTYTGEAKDRAPVEMIKGLLGANLEQRKDISFSFAKETLLVGQRLGLFISEHKEAFADAMKLNSTESQTAKVVEILRDDYSARSRNAIKELVTKAPVSKSTKSEAERLMTSIATASTKGLDFASFGKLLGEALDAKALDAFATAFDAAAKVKREAMAKAAETAAKEAKVA